MELARARTGKPRPRAFLSRGVAGTIARTLVITLPGSPGGAVEMFEALASLLPHAVETLRDEESDHAGG
jgi:molybdopterin biosynthesis enzyme MoaB